MLKRLFIQNVALIDEAELEFSEGLNVLTGETGAGKSVILDCIDFILGAKADKGMVRSGESACFVRAEFSASEETDAILREYDIEPDETLVISRKLTADGRGSLKLNGCPVTASMLRRVTSRLVDVHGQSEHFFLLKESNQLRLLDAQGGEKIAAAKEEVRTLLARRREILSGLSALGGDEGERSRRADILKFQIGEIERVSPKEGEEEALKEKRELFRNAEKILGGLNEAREALEAEGGGSDAVRSARRAVAGIARYLKEADGLADRLDAAAGELEDIAETLHVLSEEVDLDEREAERVEERLDELNAILKKYGGNVAAVMKFLGSAKEEYSLLTDSGERFSKLQGELSALDGKLFLALRALTALRKETAAAFAARVCEELKTLNIPSARFEASFDDYGPEDVDKAGAEGLDGMRFLFSANAGEPLKELGKIISGGEMSRFMLAVKAQMSAKGGIGTYIFDEIDAGIGGQTARVVAEKFARISREVQLLAVTHLARIACFADREFLIEKKEEGGKTFTRICEVEGEERIGELSRLIGGDSEHVRAHVRDLIAEAETYKKSLS